MSNAQSQHHLAFPQRDRIHQRGLNFFRHQRIVILHQADLRRHLDGNHARQLQIVQLLFKAAAQRGEIVCRLRILWQAGLFRLFHQNGQLLGARLRKLLLACQDIHGEFLKVHLVQLIHFIQHCNIL